MDQHRLNRIRFLSQRFHELQGFRVAFTGLCITVGLGSYLAVAGRPTDNGALVALLVSFVPVVPRDVVAQSYTPRRSDDRCRPLRRSGGSWP